jgi:hypothetical protein
VAFINLGWVAQLLLIAASIANPAQVNSSVRHSHVSLNFIFAFKLPVVVNLILTLDKRIFGGVNVK